MRYCDVANEENFLLGINTTPAMVLADSTLGPFKKLTSDTARLVAKQQRFQINADQPVRVISHECSRQLAREQKRRIS